MVNNRDIKSGTGAKFALGVFLAAASMGSLSSTKPATSTNPSLETRIEMIEKAPGKKVSVEISPMIILNERPETVLIQYDEQKNPVITYTTRSNSAGEREDALTLWAIREAEKPVRICNFPGREEGIASVGGAQAVIFQDRRYDKVYSNIPGEENSRVVLYSTNISEAMKKADEEHKARFEYRSNLGSVMNLYGGNEKGEIVLGSFRPLSDAGSIVLLYPDNKTYPRTDDTVKSIPFENVWDKLKDYIPPQYSKWQEMNKKANNFLGLEPKKYYGGMHVSEDGKWGVYIERKGEEIIVNRVKLSGLEMGNEK